MDEATGRFLRLQVGRLVALIDRIKRDRDPASDDRAAALINLAADLLAKAHELDAQGLRPPAPTLYKRVH